MNELFAQFTKKLKNRSRIEELANKIKPLYDFPPLSYIQPVDLYTIAFTWSPKAAEPAENLVIIDTITTFHQYGYYGFFKPSIAEVLAQIPDGFLDKVIAFQITKKPETADDLNEHIEAGYHMATTTLYEKEHP